MWHLGSCKRQCQGGVQIHKTGADPRLWPCPFAYSENAIQVSYRRFQPIRSFSITERLAPRMCSRFMLEMKRSSDRLPAWRALSEPGEARQTAVVGFRNMCRERVGPE